jgi:hypothetical protein
MKFCGQVGEVGRDHLIIAHYEVVGRVFFKKRPVPEAEGTIDCLLGFAKPYAKPRTGGSIVPYSL